MKHLLGAFALLILAACSSMMDSPTKNMTAEQISFLSDERLCELQANSNFEPKLEVELGKRNVECTQEFLSCKRQGYKPGTPTFQNCKDFENMKLFGARALDDVLRR